MQIGQFWIDRQNQTFEFILENWIKSLPENQNKYFRIPITAFPIAKKSG